MAVVTALKLFAIFLIFYSAYLRHLLKATLNVDGPTRRWTAVHWNSTILAAVIVWFVL